MTPKRKFEMIDINEHKEEEDIGSDPKRKKLAQKTKTCSQCNGVFGKKSFSIQQWCAGPCKSTGTSSNDLPSNCKSCIAKENLAPAKKTCRCCNAMLGKSSFSKTQWRGSGGKSVCKSCIDEVKKYKMCQRCKKELPKTSFLSSQWKGPVHNATRSCKDCCEKNTVQDASSDPKLLCRVCNVLLGKDSVRYRKGKCKNCTESMSVKEERACRRCEHFLSQDSFSNSQWKGNQNRLRTCKPCVMKETPKSASKVQSLDERRVETEKENDANARKLKNVRGAREEDRGGGGGATTSSSLGQEASDLATSLGVNILSPPPSTAAEDQRNLYMALLKLSEMESKFLSQVEDLQASNKTMASQLTGLQDQHSTLDRQHQELLDEREDESTIADLEHQKDTSSNRSKAQQKYEKKTKKENKQPSFESDPLVIKRKLTERLHIIPKNHERQSFQFEWATAPISQEDESSMASYVIVKGRYGRMTKQERDDLAKYIEHSPTSMVVAQAISLRSALLQQKAMFRHNHLQRNAHALFKQYKAGESIVRLSQHFDYPPMNTFRTVLSMDGHGKAKIKKCLRDPKKELNSREQREYAEAESADSVSHANHDVSRKFADIFEDIIARFLRKRGICFVKQTQMETEQKKSFGKPILTPDFLLLDEVFINGQQVTWIDAKAFYGANIHFNIKKLRKQMSRYTDRWGGGAIMYLQGFSENLRIDGCTMLTAQGLISTEELLPLEQLIAKEFG